MLDGDWSSDVCSSDLAASGLSKETPSSAPYWRGTPRGAIAAYIASALMPADALMEEEPDGTAAPDGGTLFPLEPLREKSCIWLKAITATTPIMSA
jgi:hypothetical protein